MKNRSRWSWKRFSLSQILIGAIALSSLAPPSSCADPTEDPIQNLDSVDIIGKGKDGTVSLMIVSSQHLDGTKHQRELFAKKLRAYLAALSDPEFQKEYGDPSTTQYTITLTCVDKPAPGMLDTLARVWPAAQASGATLYWRNGSDGKPERAEDIVPQSRYGPYPFSSELTEAELAALQKCATLTESLLRERYGHFAKLSHSRLDLDLLQRLVIDMAPTRKQFQECEAIGVALGNVLAKQAGLKWVVHEDEMGRVPALIYPGTTILVFPKTMVSKRVEDGREIDMKFICDSIVAQVNKNKGDPNFRQ